MTFKVIPHQFWRGFNYGDWELDTKDFYKKYTHPHKEIIDIEGAKQNIASGLDYISGFKEICVLLSIHRPFWDNPDKVANILFYEFRKFDIFFDKDEKLSKEEIKDILAGNAFFILSNIFSILVIDLGFL